MTTEHKCPQCNSAYVYADGTFWVCPECAHEWTPQVVASAPQPSDAAPGVRDAHGTPLQDGDTITVIKDLKVKGSSAVVKVGTKVKNIRLIDSTDGHNISVKISGMGAMNLKSEFVKKSL